MFLAVAALLQRYVDGFAASRFAEMAAMHTYPCPVQLEDRLLVLRTPADLIAGMSRHRQSLADRGATDFTFSIAAVELPRAGRFRVWARHAHRGPDGASGDETHAVYFLHERPDCGRPDGRLVIEMLDVTRLATEDVKTFVPAHAAIA